MYDIRKQCFEKIVERVLRDYKYKTTEETIELVDSLCEEYVQVFGKKPAQYQLTLLADLILKEDIKNPSSYKIQEEEYPFLSNHQKKRRRKREFVTSDAALDHMNYKRKVKLSTAPTKDMNK